MNLPMTEQIFKRFEKILKDEVRMSEDERLSNSMLAGSDGLISNENGFQSSHCDAIQIENTPSLHHQMELQLSDSDSGLDEEVRCVNQGDVDSERNGQRLQPMISKSRGVSRRSKIRSERQKRQMVEASIIQEIQKMNSELQQVKQLIQLCMEKIQSNGSIASSNVIGEQRDDIQALHDPKT
eukprot:TRINITY_DN7438_c0_g1_i1.p1 TRINITY_DN7438_c0_g1~~TRINITY_DN7438_c0_g1_i1.p1  ORF type:complete len:182 (-),score=36.26 TRINITY_DN7438_c0_g1_i1:157-702(-)